MSRKHIVPVEVSGTLSIPLDVAILNTLRGEIGGEALHNMILTEAIKIGVSESFGGFDKISIRRELVAATSSSSDNSASNKNKNKNKLQQQQQEGSGDTKKPSTTQQPEHKYDEASAARLMANDDDDDDETNRDDGDDVTKMKNPTLQDLSTLPKNAASSKKGDVRPTDTDNHHNPFAGERFLAEVDLRGLQSSIQRLISAFDSMAGKIEATINGPLQLLHERKPSLSEDVATAIDQIQASLAEAVAPPSVPTEVPGSSAVAVAGGGDGDGNVKRHAAGVEESEEMAAAKFGRRRNYSGDDDKGSDDDGDDHDSDDGSFEGQDPAAMGYEPLLDDTE